MVSWQGAHSPGGSEHALRGHDEQHVLQRLGHRLGQLLAARLGALRQRVQHARPQRRERRLRRQRQQELVRSGTAQSVTHAH